MRGLLFVAASESQASQDKSVLFFFLNAKI